MTHAVKLPLTVIGHVNICSLSLTNMSNIDQGAYSLRINQTTKVSYKYKYTSATTTLDALNCI